jgi:hypothetical protein
LRLISKLLMAMGAVWLLTFAMSSSASADEVPACLDSATQGNPVEAQNWWDRRTPEAQNYMRTLPCEERYIVAVCVFLYEPDLKACTNKGLARFRGDRHCAEQGHAMLSESKAACMEEYEQNFSDGF